MPPETTEKGPLRLIDASFNIFESGWGKYGNHRKYITNNVDALVNGDIVQERVDNGVMVGFFGHNSNKELEAVERSDNPASHKTMYLKFYPTSGDVEHRQSINRNKPGKAVLGLHDSDVGNWSWRGKGDSSFLGARFSPEAERHLRFDYVYQPGFVKQEKKDVIIKESVGEFQDLFDRFREMGLVGDDDGQMTIEEAVSMCADWQLHGMMISGLENRLHEAAIQEGILQEQVNAFKHASAQRVRLVEEALRGTVYTLSPEAMKALTGIAEKGDTEPLSESDFVALFETLKSYGAVEDPVPDNRGAGITFPAGVLEDPNGEDFNPKASGLAVFDF